ncbi:hypothetical protein K3495_g13223 [Podosphaera aphanis]|nr:hypothetical protein K3495_g13223 [Podosphaera aphanis]
MARQVVSPAPEQFFWCTAPPQPQYYCANLAFSHSKLLSIGEQSPPLRASANSTLHIHFFAEPIASFLSSFQRPEVAKQSFLSFLQTIPTQDIIVYSDGSKQQNGAAGAGFVAYQGGIQVLQQSIALGIEAEVFDAEAKGAKAALRLSSTKFATNLWICLDNLEVAIHLLSPFPGSS